jgi:hypothetical protein
LFFNGLRCIRGEMKPALLATALILVPVAGADAMSVADFLAKADALKAKGAMALFSSDLKVLKREAEAAGAQLRAERLAAQKAGRKPAYCPPGKGGQMSSDQMLAILRSVPPQDRARLHFKDALRAHFARTYPC